ERVLDVAVGDHRKRRPELLLVDQTDAFADVRDHRRRIEVARLRERRAACDDRAALAAGVVDELLDARELRRIVDRSELCFGLEPVPDLHLPGEADERIEDGTVDVLVDVEPLDRDAYLARV